MVISRFMLFLKYNKRYFGKVLLFFIIILLFLLLLVFDPAEISFFPPCPFHLVTGLYCPGCGSLRAVYQLLHGHFITALDLNPLMVLFLPFLGGVALSYFSYILTGRYLFSLRFLNSKSFSLIILWLFITYWILRNIPCFPFNILAP